MTLRTAANAGIVKDDPNEWINPIRLFDIAIEHGEHAIVN
jgi:hypothetical protein